jgi:hypothetical protein
MSGTSGTSGTNGMNKVLAFLLPDDLHTVPGGDPAAVVSRVCGMAADGHLVDAAPGPAAVAAMLGREASGGRWVRPTAFLGNDAEGMLAYLCDVLGTIPGPRRDSDRIVTDA